MIFKRLTRLEDHGIYRDLSWPQEIQDFGRFNLIYGWNGTGKTTMSRLFRALELREVPTPGQVKVRIDDQDVSGADFPQATLPVRVFNRDLVNESIFPIGGGEVPPIFIVGKEGVEKQKEVERLKQARVEADDEWSAARARHQEAARAFDQYCQGRARVIKDTLRSSGKNPFNNYNKSSFKEQAAQLVTDDEAASHCLNDSKRQTLVVQHRGAPKSKLSEIAYRLPDLQALAGATSALLQKTVVSAAIQSLKDDSEVADWIRRGLGLHSDRHADKCLFCEQPIPEDRIGSLEAHFSAEYEQFMREIDDQITKLESIRAQTSELKLPSRAEFYDDLAVEYETAEGALRKAADAAGRFVKSLSAALGNKRAKAFEALPMDVDAPEIDTSVVQAVNEVIRKHNRASEEFTMRVSSARERLAKDLIASDIDEFERLKNAVRSASGELKTAKHKSDELAARINKIEGEIIEHRQPAEDLNNDLQQYLGHGELRLVVKDTGYTVTRNGEQAQMLSEGEMTAIALLYFLKSLEGRDFDLASGVVVLDDPVSSLDANALYLAFGYIRERTEGAGQLFVLTHNFAFFRQVRNWFHHLPGQRGKNLGRRLARFYMLEPVHGSDPRCSNIRSLDPLLEQFESEYHYLFSRIYRRATAPVTSGLEDSYSLPNMARRFLEAFLAFRQPASSGDLWKKMKASDFDEAKKLRILRFLHTYSHGDAVGDPEHDLSVLSEAGSILQDLMQFVEAQDPEHFAGMVGLMNSMEGEGI